MLFVIRVVPPQLSGIASRLHLSSGEVIVFALLLFFSALGTYGFWRVVVDLLYIYFFPFVLLFIFVKWSFLGLREISRLLSKGTVPATSRALTVSVPAVTPESPSATTPAKAIGWKSVRDTFVRPFRRFTLLWCILLLVTTHRPLLKFALAIVIIHIAFTVFFVLEVTLFSRGLIAGMEARIRQTTNDLLAKIASVTPDTQATPDLQSTFSALSGIRVGLLFLKNRSLIAGWAVFLGSVFLGFVYVYLAVLFSFVYHSVARLQFIEFTYPDALVTSLFIPFAFTTLPHSVWLKLVAGIHGTIVVVAGTGTILNYLTQEANQLHSVALVLSSRFEDEDVRTRLTLLENKFKRSQITASAPGES